MRRGWVFIDAVWGMILLSLLAGILATAANRQQVGLARLSDTRAAVRLAEQTLFDLQQRRPLSNLNSDESISVVKLNQLGTWVDAKAIVRGRSADLIGYIPPAAESPP
jgi:hypothetical protein